ncbi:MAG: hypothetical protein EBR47_13655 [Betaproteobacteria bacterium]|nr:hypothetical protein [Betaproteobacteria bacterium]
MPAHGLLGAGAGAGGVARGAAVGAALGAALGAAFGVAGFVASRCVTWLDCCPIDLPPPKRLAASAGTQTNAIAIVNTAIQFFMSSPSC